MMVHISVWAQANDRRTDFYDGLAQEEDAHDVLRDALWTAGVEQPERAITCGGPVQNMGLAMVHWEIERPCEDHWHCSGDECDGDGVIGPDTGRRDRPCPACGEEP